MLDWMKRQANSDDFGARVSELEDLMQKAVISALTDVWSATRKVCAQRFKAMGQLLTLEHLHGFFRTLLDAWNESEVSWKAKEGILLGLAAVIAQFSQIDTNGADAPKDQQACILMRLRFGLEELDALPSFITQHLKPLLFGALAHPQLSVRENAAKAFSCYLSRTPLHETHVCLAEVIRKLQAGGRKEAGDGGSGGAEREDSNAPRNVLVEAFEAQGLLSLTSDLLERLPSRLILQQWDSLIASFSLYLSHSASTVRQACSSLFLKFMAKSDEGAPSLQRLVLQGLSTTCKTTDTNIREGSILPSEGISHSPTFQSEGVGALVSAHGGLDEENDATAQTWEDREGRLLAYELVLGFLVEDHTLKMFKSDPTAVGVTSCSPKKMSPVDSGHYTTHHECDFSDCLEHDVSHRAQSPDPESGNQDLARQTNMSPYNVSWLQSPALSFTPGASSEAGSTRRGSSPVRNRRKSSPNGRRSPFRLSPTRGSRIRVGESPTRVSARKAANDSEKSVLDKFRFTDDTSLTGESEDLSGVGLTVTFEPLGMVLDRMFEEALYSIGHARWELRRMGLQVLPLLCTTALWYESSLLEDLLKRWLLADPSFRRSSSSAPTYAYVGALALKEIVKKASIPFLTVSPSFSVSGHNDLAEVTYLCVVIMVSSCVCVDARIAHLVVWRHCRYSSMQTL